MSAREDASTIDPVAGVSRRTGMLRALALLLAVPALAAAPAASAQEADVKPDFSNVADVATAEKLVAEGKLEAIYLFPTELGGQEARENVAYVTPEAAEAHQM